MGMTINYTWKKKMSRADLLKIYMILNGFEGVEETVSI